MTNLDTAKVLTLLDRLDALTNDALGKSLERTRRRELAARIDVTDALRAAIASGSYSAAEPEPIVKVIKQVVPGPPRAVAPTAAPGKSCPTCGRIVRTADRRRLSRSAVLFVALAHRDNGILHEFKATEVIAAGIRYGITRDGTQAKWWNLIEPVGHGLYRVTAFGAKFIHGGVAAPAYRVLTLTGEFHHFEGDDLTVSDLVDPGELELVMGNLVGV